MTQGDTKIAHTATAGDGGLREAATRLLNACISDFGLGDDDDDDSAVGGGATPADNMAITFGHLRGLQAALAQAPAVEAPAGELNPAIDPSDGQPVTVDYINYRGERGTRRIMPSRIVYGATEYHPRHQWLLEAFDLDKSAMRVFALEDMRFLDSPTPTDAQPKAARPVGDDALREALKKVVSSALYKNQFKRDWREHIDPVANAVLAALAPHLTTGQETVATPRDGGVREALVEILWENFGPCYGGGAYQQGGRIDWCYRDQHPSAVRKLEGVADKIAALSTPGSAGPGEPDPFAVGTLVEKSGGEYLFPGTVVASFLKLGGQRRYVVEDDRRSLHIFSAANLRATPATTAETRGPAEGAR